MASTSISVNTLRTIPDINKVDTDGNTILHYVCATYNNTNNSSDSFQFAIEIKNANLNAQNSMGNTPLHNLFNWLETTFKLVKYVIKHEGDLTIQNKQGYIPLYYICCTKHMSLELVKLIVEYSREVKYDLTAKISDRLNSCLHVLCSNLHITMEIIRYLMEDLNVNMLDDKCGITPFEILCISNYGCNNKIVKYVYRSLINDMELDEIEKIHKLMPEGLLKIISCN